jgi:signal peptidase I
MKSTLEDGELILTNKLEYRTKSPQRGDVITFKAPNDPKKDFIKRIIALPEEKIEVTKNQVKIYNKQYPDGFILDETSYLDKFQIVEPGIFLRDGEAVDIPKDQYVVMGDNRLNSYDSRNFGLLKKDAIIGKAWFVYWPFNRMGYSPEHHSDK